MIFQQLHFMVNQTNTQKSHSQGCARPEFRHSSVPPCPYDCEQFQSTQGILMLEFLGHCGARSQSLHILEPQFPHL